VRALVSWTLPFVSSAGTMISAVDMARLRKSLAVYTSRNMAGKSRMSMALALEERGNGSRNQPIDHQKQPNRIQQGSR